MAVLLPSSKGLTMQFLMQMFAINSMFCKALRYGNYSPLLVTHRSQGGGAKDFDVSQNLQV